MIVNLPTCRQQIDNLFIVKFYIIFLQYLVLLFITHRNIYVSFIVTASLQEVSV